MGKLSRTKGAVAEREFAGEFYAWTGIKLRRKLDQYQFAGGFDLEPEPNQPDEAIALVHHLAIECKRYQRVTDGLVAGWWSETREQAIKVGKVPVLAYRGDRMAWRVMVSAKALPSTQHLTGNFVMTVEDFGSLVREGMIQ
ncbi:hypothetical protein [Ferrimonas balearica]|uniref:putative PDDEXK endonuclease n=1 Tax=Ferrimonas balearica TaxID=44012 RepID=UPI001C995587|nr:hypothetical protein [Ferrimonas balearica]MBY5992495.1 hypothetical protein [Ferrimonas balearica]